MSNSLCPLNFHQLYIHSSGEVYPCGFLQGDYSYGNITKQSLKEIWENNKVEEFQQTHIEGTNEHCSKCQKLYNCHLLHENLWDRKSSDHQFKLKKLDIMIDSFCNLKCIMCTNRSEENGGFLNDFFWNELEHNILPHLEEIEVVGGEPLISKDTYKLMDLVIKINPKIRWIITTNGHLDFNKALSSRLEQINIHSFAVSIDSLDSNHFKYIRVNGELNKTLKFLEDLKKFKKDNCREFFIIINFLVQKDNYSELEDFLLFQNKVNTKVYPILLREPVQFSIFSLDYTDLLKIFDDYINIGQRHNNLYVKNIVSKIGQNIKKVDLAPRISEIQKMASYD